MQPLNPPKTNTKSTFRDAAAQIDDDDNGNTFENLDNQFERLAKKVQAIKTGAIEMQDKWTHTKYENAVYELAWICGQLTSASKLQRDDGKKALRDMVNIGTKVIAQQEAENEE